MKNEKKDIQTSDIGKFFEDDMKNYGFIYDRMENSIVEGCNIIAKTISKTLKDKSFDESVHEFIKEAVADMIYEHIHKMTFDVKIVIGGMDK